MGPKMVSKWNQDLEKDSAELILDAMRTSANKNAQKSQEEVSESARERPRAGPGCP